MLYVEWFSCVINVKTQTLWTRHRRLLKEGCIHLHRFFYKHSWVFKIICDGISMPSMLNFDNLSTSSKGPSSSHVPGSEHLLHPSLWSSLWKQQPVLSALIFTFLRGQHSHSHKRGTLGKAVIKSWSAQAIHLMYLSSVNGRLMVAMPAWRGLWNIYQQIALINGSTCSLSEEWD